MNTLTKSTFKQFINTNFSNTSIKNSQNENWNIHPQLYDAVYNGMPTNDLSLEDKAIYIYLKLCKIFTYNENFFYRNNLKNGVYDATFSSTHLENITSKSKITCFDFSRIFTKMVNDIKGDIEAVIISQGGNRGHFLTGFYTDKISVRLEAININLNGKKDPTNDLMKAKNGIKLRGITPQSDREYVIGDALDTVYQSIYGRQALSIKGFVQEMKSLPETDVPDDTKLKLESFIEVMRDKGIVGNEFVQTLDGMFKTSFFGKDVEKAYLGKRMEHDGEKHIQRMILFRQKGAEEQEKPHFYLIDTSTLEMVEPTSEQLIEELNSGSMIYESEQHKIAGIDKEADDDTIK